LDEAGDSVAECRQRVDKSEQQISEQHAELTQLRRQLTSTASDRESDKHRIAELQLSLDSAHTVGALHGRHAAYIAGQHVSRM